jgi:DNA-binding NarL/FixJ family response regulator/anti-sigma regulatory factor (Ser/Thr protein kinase)
VELARLAGITQQAIQDVQHAIHSMLGRSRTEVAGVVRQGGLRADADETGERGRDGVIALPNALSYAQESSIIAIIQEALSNARRHAAPGVIDVAVDVSGPELTIVVRDDGRGFNVAEALAGGRRSGRSGLRRMQERARLLGATLDIASHPGGGTSVLLRMRCDQVHGSPVTVLVVDDHQLGRAGLVRLLADYVMLTVVGEAGTVAEAAAQAEALNPDVIVMTTDLLGDDGRAAVRAITQRRPDTRLVLLTGHGRDDVVFDALCAGASGVLPRDIALDELARTIHAVAQGGAVLSSRLARRLLDVLQRGDGPAEPRRKPAPDELSAREREVLARIAAGQTCRAIATALGLSENTVKRHTSNLYQKLHVHHRSQATAEAIRRGLIPADAADAVAASS